MADLIVTSADVNEAAEQLAAIYEDLDQADENRAEWRKIFGHDVVDDAIHAFIDDWWVKREALLENIEDLRDKMKQSAEAWDDAEAQLAAVFESEEG